MNKLSLNKESNLWTLVFGMTMLVYIAGLFVTIMEPDAAVYAEVSMEMHKSGNYLEIFRKGVDWLDKPHFHFWITAFSYKFFGVNSFAYKFPAVIFTLLAALYTWLFTKRYYSRQHAFFAVIILITAQHVIISNQDVRAEPYLMGLTIMGLYHLTAFMESRKIIHLLAGSLALACMMMTKGLFTIIPVAAGIGLSLIYSKKWSAILHWQWLVCVILTAIFLSPALYGYYKQFDLHPEKVVFGSQNQSGIKFFLWDSQWGRFSNTGPIKGKGDISYFIHTTIWAFLPWAFLAFFALYQKVRQLVKGITIGENYTFFGFITLFLVFSFSRFQLSFYLNPLFPLLAILTTAAIFNNKENLRFLKTFTTLQIVSCSLLLVVLIALHYFFSGAMLHLDTLILLIAGFGIAIYLFTRRGMWINKIVFGAAIVTLSINYYLNREFYPQLLVYQSESEMAKFVKSSAIPPDQIVAAGEEELIGDVMLQQVIPTLDTSAITSQNLRGKFVYTTQEGFEKIQALGIKFDLLKTFDDFPVTRLTGKFINRKTRASELKKKYLLKITG